MLSPDEAVERVVKGNKRYTSGSNELINFVKARLAIASGRNPGACLLSCADSRIGPDCAFDEGDDDLFVTSVASNFVITVMQTQR